MYKVFLQACNGPLHITDGRSPRISQLNASHIIQHLFLYKAFDISAVGLNITSAKPFIYTLPCIYCPRPMTLWPQLVDYYSRHIQRLWIWISPKSKNFTLPHVGLQFLSRAIKMLKRKYWGWFAACQVSLVLSTIYVKPVGRGEAGHRAEIWLIALA